MPEKNKIKASPEGYEDDALNMSAEETAARSKAIREAMEANGYVYVGDEEVGIPGKIGKRFVRPDILDERNAETADEKITFKDWLAAKRETRAHKRAGSRADLDDQF
jgi:hypothetical protein